MDCGRVLPAPIVGLMSEGSGRVIELGLGALLIAGAMVVATGTAPAVLGIVDLFSLLGYGGAALMAAFGGLLCAAGLTRLALKREGAHRHGLRSGRLTAASLLTASALAIGLPLFADLLNLVRIDGFPLGYYLAAQGVLIALVLLAFGWARRQNRIDADEPTP
jgi:putative solute:sodium symporter small subunit